MDWIVATAPGQVPELRDRAMVYEALECFRPALADFERYLACCPDAEDAVEVRRKIIAMRNRAAQLN
jgi:regulator of sirC expression with transglutaminase-like and TPR domain